MSVVLVLDDCRESLEVMADIVRDAGHQPLTAGHLSRALALASEHSSELVLFAANAHATDAGTLQEWMFADSTSPPPTVLLYGTDELHEPLDLATRLSGAIDDRDPGYGPARTAAADGDGDPVRALELELDRKVSELEAAQAERLQLMIRLVSAQEAERERIAADIHDDSLQVMASAVLRLGMLARTSASESQQDAIYSVALAIEAAIGRLRRLLFELNPPGLANSNLGTALHDYMLEFASEAAIEWTVTDRLVRQPSGELKQVLFRVAQEALRNVRKHADAKRVDIRLGENDGGVLLQISDDGVGFAPEEAWRSRAGHIGMPSMRERMERVGGWLETRSAPGAGAIVEAWLPHLEHPHSETVARNDAGAPSGETNDRHVH